MSEQSPRPGPPLSAGGLISEALSHLAAILRGELALAQTEMAAAIRRAGIGLALLVGSVILSIIALNLAAAGLVAAVVQAGLSPPLATAAVAGGFAVLALVLAWIGLRELRPSGFVPTRALRGLQRDAETLKDSLKKGLTQ